MDEYVGKDWRSINFRQDHAIHLNKNSYCVFMCPRARANIGECQYAVCHVCHEEQSKTQKRTRGRVLSDDDLMETFHHELRNLQLCADIWWCVKDYLGGQQWLERAKGCVFLWENVRSGGKVNHFFVGWINPKICFFNLLRVNPELPAKLEKNLL